MYGLDDLDNVEIQPMESRYNYADGEIVTQMRVINGNTDLFTIKVQSGVYDVQTDSFKDRKKCNLEIHKWMNAYAKLQQYMLESGKFPSTLVKSQDSKSKQMYIRIKGLKLEIY